MFTVSNPPTLQPAGLFRRLGAICYDALLLFAVLCIATVLVLPLNGGAAISHNSIFFLYVYAVCFLFFGWFWTHGGQTLGMRAWELRLQSYAGGSISWWQALARFLLASLWLLPMILSEVLLRDIILMGDLKARVKISLTVGLGFLLLLLITRLHERYSETVLVRISKPPHPAISSKENGNM
jgi:uncharacterized RDD family membrane protein YckC